MKFSFGEFELDESRLELRHQGEIVKAEPLIVEALIYLVRHRERVVTKDELIEKVWKLQAVSDAAVARCVMGIRRAVGDRGRRQEIIKTAHGRGYRFIAPVAERAEESRAAEATLAGFVPESANDSSAVDSEQEQNSIDSAPPSADEAATGDDSKSYSPLSPVQQAERARGEPSAIGKEQSRPATVSGRRWSSATLVAGLLLLVGVTAAGWFASRLFWPRQEAALEVRLPPKHLALTPIEVAGDNGELQLLALSITDLLVQRLAVVPNLSVRGPFYESEGAVAMSDLTEFAARTGATHLIAGDLRRAAEGARAHLSLTLYEAQPPGGLRATSLGAYEIPLLSGPADVSHFTAVRDRIAQRLLAELLPALSLQPVADIAPRNLEAYRLYLQALVRLRQVECEGRATLDALERSLQLDPDFAPAWEARALAQYNLVSSCAREAGYYNEALASLERALALAPVWARAWALKAAILVETGRVEEAYALLREANARFPEKAELQFLLSYALAYAGLLPESRAWMERTAATEPIYFMAEGWTPNVLLYQQEWPRFLEFVSGGDAPLFRYYRGYAEMMQGEREKAARTLEPAFRQNPTDVFSRLSQALLEILQGNSADARLILRQLAFQRARLGGSDGEVTYKLAHLFVLAGAPEEGLEQLRLAVSQGFFCAPCLENDPLLDPVKQSPAFQQTLAVARARQTEFRHRFDLR